MRESYIWLIAMTSWLFACSTVDAPAPSADAGVDQDAQVWLADAANADGNVDGAPVDMPAAVDLCNMTGDGSFASQCCPFEDSCDAGLYCYYDWSNQQHPTQEHSQCLPSPPSAPALGEECPPNGDCADGLFCDRVMSGEIGHCRELCDDANPCAIGMTCHGIPLCAQGACIEADGELGYCAP